jgi:hypothetical protein
VRSGSVSEVCQVLCADEDAEACVQGLMGCTHQYYPVSGLYEIPLACMCGFVDAIDKMFYLPSMRRIKK